MKITKKMGVLATGAAVVAVAGAGVSYALWSSNAAGSARAEALSAVNLTVAAATGAADLYPGFAGGDIHFTLTNTNPYPVTFTSMTPGTVTSGDPTNCPASNVTIAAKSGLSLTVAANSTSPALSITDVATMVSAAPDGCQGVAFTIAVSMSGSQAS